MIEQYLITFDGILPPSLSQIQDRLKNSNFPPKEVIRVGPSSDLVPAIGANRIELLSPIKGPIIFSKEEVKKFVGSLIKLRLKTQAQSQNLKEAGLKKAIIKEELKNIRQQVSHIEELLSQLTDDEEDGE